MDVRTESRSIGQLVTNLISDVGTLIQQEVSLARSEVTERVSKVGSGVGKMLFGGAIMYAGLTIMLLAAVIELALILPQWLAALSVGSLVTLIGLIFMLSGRSALSQVNPMADRASKKHSASAD
jgi:hypothetical protein